MCMYACSAIPPGNFLVGDKRKNFFVSLVVLCMRLITVVARS